MEKNNLKKNSSKSTVKKKKLTEKDIDKYTKEAAFGLGAIILYFLLHSIQGLPFKVAGIDTDNLADYIKIIYLSIYEIFMFSLYGIIFYKDLEKDAKDMKKNHKKYFKENFKYYLMGFAVMMISNAIIIFLLNKNIAANEESIRKIFAISPIYMFFSGIIFAPFVEELVFRKSIKMVTSTKYLYIAISGILFAFVHVSSSVDVLSDFLYLIPYGALGVSFAYVYHKTNNIFTSIGLHLFHNGILISLQFLLLLIG